MHIYLRIYNKYFTHLLTACLHIHISRAILDSGPPLGWDIFNPFVDGSPHFSASATQGIICFSVIFSFRVNWPDRMVGK